MHGQKIYYLHFLVPLTFKLKLAKYNEAVVLWDNFFF